MFHIPPQIKDRLKRQQNKKGRETHSAFDIFLRRSWRPRWRSWRSAGRSSCWGAAAGEACAGACSAGQHQPGTGQHISGIIRSFAAGIVQTKHLWASLRSPRSFNRSSQPRVTWIPYLSKVQWVFSSQHCLCSHHRAWSDQSWGASEVQESKHRTGSSEQEAIQLKR